MNTGVAPITQRYQVFFGIVASAAAKLDVMNFNAAPCATYLAPVNEDISRVLMAARNLPFGLVEENGGSFISGFPTIRRAKHSCSGAPTSHCSLAYSALAC